MAAIFIIAGGIVGFASALASLILMEASFLTAFAIWSGIGLLALILGLGFAMLPRRSAASSRRTQGTA